MTTPTPHTATMRATMLTKAEQELLLTVARLLRAHLRESTVGDYVVEDVATMNDALKPWEGTVTALHPDQCAREADPLDKQGVEAIPVDECRFPSAGGGEQREERCDCGQMTRADCDALPSARHCGKFNEATAGVEQSASADPPPVSPQPTERLEQEYERMDAAIEAFHKAWPSFSAWFLRDDEMKIINTPPEPFEAFLEVWNRRPPAPPQPAAQQAEAVKRLREQAGQCTCYACELMREAARECERLGAENTTLRADCARQVSLADGYMEEIIVIQAHADAAERERDELRAQLDALPTATQQQKAPSPAMALVPVEPTLQMFEAFNRAAFMENKRVVPEVRFNRAYRAMLSAAQGKGAG